MASNLISTATATVIAILFPLLLAGKSQSFSTSLPPSMLRHGRQKLTHLNFYYHDVVAGPYATAIRVAAAPMTDTIASGFGFVAINDNLLTMGPEPNSTHVGRAQGMYAGSDFKEESFMMVQNFVFHQERFNGSTLSMLGRHPIYATVRELTVVGGSGVFRFARGFAKTRTHFANYSDIIIEYNVYVIHY